MQIHIECFRYRRKQDDVTTEDPNTVSAITFMGKKYAVIYLCSCVFMICLEGFE